MKIPFYQIDAFSKKIFGGNPAAVCPLESWPTDEILQNMARRTIYPKPHSSYKDQKVDTNSGGSLPPSRSIFAAMPRLQAYSLFFRLSIIH